VELLIAIKNFQLPINLEKEFLFYYFHFNYSFNLIIIYLNAKINIKIDFNYFHLHFKSTCFHKILSSHLNPLFINSYKTNANNLQYQLKES
jgi:hypothetical protein